jgi:hypothetical protein
MNEPQLRSLFREATTGVVADPEVADVAWARARGRSRRTRTASLAAVGAVAAVVVSLVVRAPHDGSPATGKPPMAGDPWTTSSTDTGSYQDQLRAVVQPVWHESTYRQLPMLDTTLPPTLRPDDPDLPSLSADPIHAAVAVAQLRAPSIELRVLGDDQRWRRLDIAGLEVTPADCCAGLVIAGHPLSPDGETLVVGQPHGVVVVDLVSGQVRHISVPGMRVQPGKFPVLQWTGEGAQVAVGVGTPDLEPRSGWLVDTETGEVRSVPYDPADTGFAPDGTAYELANWGCGLCEIRRYAGTEAGGHLLLGVGLYETRPVVDEVAAVSMAVRSWSPDSVPRDRDGLLVIDPASGRPLAQLPLDSANSTQSTTLYGWLDDHTVVFGSHGRLVAWNYRTGLLSRLTDESFAWDRFSLALAVGSL